MNLNEFILKVKELGIELNEHQINQYNKYYELLNSEELDKILNDGMIKTTNIAKKKYEELKQLVGLCK